MPLTPSELRLFEEACANRANQGVASLLNVFGAATASQILEQIAAAPVTIRKEFMEHVRRAIEEQRRFRPKG